MINIKFSEQTRKHFLNILTSIDWWNETQLEIRKTCELDKDFNEEMFNNQISLIKGQGWNVVEVLKLENSTPIDLINRQEALIIDEEIDHINSHTDHHSDYEHSINSQTPLIFNDHHDYHYNNNDMDKFSDIDFIWPQPFSPHQISFETKKINRKRVIKKLKKLTIRPCFTSC